MKPLSFLRAIAVACVVAIIGSACVTTERSDSSFYLPEESPRSWADNRIEDLRAKTKERPRDPEIHYEIAEVHFQQGEFRDAAASLERAISLEEDTNPRYHYHLGRVYLNLRERDKARKHFELAVKYTRDTRYSGPRAALAYVFALEKRLDEALEQFQRCIEIEPSNPEFYYFVGALYDLKRDDENAIRYFREYLDRGGRKYRSRAVSLLEHLGVEVAPELRRNDAPRGELEESAAATREAELRSPDDLPDGIADPSFLEEATDE
ncbi:MAG TPA: tetratricopeptide repeat protein [Planctomycetota bacterium]|nr:tetratricopeptide repeat protein [Planctomycetota bacterium]